MQDDRPPRLLRCRRQHCVNLEHGGTSAFEWLELCCCTLSMSIFEFPPFFRFADSETGPLRGETVASTVYSIVVWRGEGAVTTTTTAGLYATRRHINPRDGT